MYHLKNILHLSAMALLALPSLTTAFKDGIQCNEKFKHTADNQTQVLMQDLHNIFNSMSSATFLQNTRTPFTDNMPMDAANRYSVASVSARVCMSNPFVFANTHLKLANAVEAFGEWMAHCCPNQEDPTSTCNIGSNTFPGDDGLTLRMFILHSENDLEDCDGNINGMRSAATAGVVAAGTTVGGGTVVLGAAAANAAGIVPLGATGFPGGAQAYVDAVAGLISKPIALDLEAQGVLAATAAADLGAGIEDAAAVAAAENFLSLQEACDIFFGCKGGLSAFEDATGLAGVDLEASGAVGEKALGEVAEKAAAAIGDVAVGVAEGLDGIGDFKRKRRAVAFKA